MFFLRFALILIGSYPEKSTLVIAFSSNKRLEARLVEKALYQLFKNRTLVDNVAQTVELCRDGPDIKGATVREFFFLPEVNRCLKVLQIDRHSSFPVWSSWGDINHTLRKNNAIVMSYRLPLPNILCREAAQSNWRMLDFDWLHGHTIYQILLSRQRLKIKTIKPRQLHVRPWCGRKLPRFLMQVHITVVLEHELRYMRRKSFGGWEALSGSPGNTRKATSSSCTMLEV